MTLKMYEYTGCGTCKKARRWLDEQGIAYETVPIREQPPTLPELERMRAEYGIRKLFNTSGQDYRVMGIKDRLPDMDTAEALQLLSTHGNLVKRPFVLGDGVALVGFNEKDWAAALKDREAK